ncbi:hypothetical protein Daesc_002937 [Daldinia eschscholtzii]|uniref:Uncharacterized protein n=1 Tax=Daldinia eschscholtzii TaxID=292717 RepID=A0AAX6MS27_9PEZI
MVDSFNATAVEMLNTTAGALANAAAEELAKRREEWTGLGIEWLRSLLGRREWRIECMDLATVKPHHHLDDDNVYFEEPGR